MTNDTEARFASAKACMGNMRPNPKVPKPAPKAKITPKGTSIKGKRIGVTITKRF